MKPGFFYKNKERIDSIFITLLNDFSQRKINMWQEGNNLIVIQGSEGLLFIQWRATCYLTG